LPWRAGAPMVRSLWPGDSWRQPRCGARQGIGWCTGRTRRRPHQCTSWLPVALWRTHGSSYSALARHPTREKKEMEGERWEVVAPDIKEGGRRLTSSEEDGGFGSLSSCDLDGDDLQGRRREVSVAAEGSECGGRWCGDPTGEGAEHSRVVTVAWRGRTRDGRNNAFMAWARQQCFPRHPIWVRHVVA
jgi:hypothetical protein